MTSLPPRFPPLRCLLWHHYPLGSLRYDLYYGVTTPSVPSATMSTMTSLPPRFPPLRSLLWRHYPLGSLRYDLYYGVTTPSVPSATISTMASLNRMLFCRCFLYHEVTTLTMTSLLLLWRHYSYYDVTNIPMTSLNHILCCDCFLYYDVTTPSVMTSHNSFTKPSTQYGVITINVINPPTIFSTVTSLTPLLWRH